MEVHWKLVHWNCESKKEIKETPKQRMTNERINRINDRKRIHGKIFHSHTHTRAQLQYKEILTEFSVASSLYGDHDHGNDDVEPDGDYDDDGNNDNNEDGNGSGNVREKRCQ